jgi:hypothetical protein
MKVQDRRLYGDFIDTPCGVSSPIPSPIPSPIQSLAASPPQEIVLEMVLEMTLHGRLLLLSPCGLLSWTFLDPSKSKYTLLPIDLYLVGWIYKRIRTLYSILLGIISLLYVV